MRVSITKLQKKDASLKPPRNSDINIDIERLDVVAPIDVVSMNRSSSEFPNLVEIVD